jgi:hypothetical protein
MCVDEMDPARYGASKPPVAAGHGAGDLHVDIFPGEPDQSILPFRMQSTAPGVAMPEFGRQTAHVEALAVINAWIASLSGTCQ